MKKMNKLLGICAILTTMILALQTDILAQSKTEILIVADKTTNCPTAGAATGGNCLQIKRINEEKFTPLSENIHNFQFVPGYFYLLEVSLSPADNPSAADASKLKYQLEKILARVRSENSPSSTQPNFFGTEWKLIRMEGNALKIENAFIKFDEQKKEVTGNGGCNGFNGTFIKTGNQIQFPEIFATKKFCVATSVTEIKYIGNLDRITRYELAGGKLTLFAENEAILEFEAKK